MAALRRRSGRRMRSKTARGLALIGWRWAKWGWNCRGRRSREKPVTPEKRFVRESVNASVNVCGP